MVIRTPRLELIAATQAHLEAELEDPAGLSSLLAATVPASWPPGEYDRSAMAFFRRGVIDGGAGAAGWYGWYGVRRATAGMPASLVASAGFIGPPDGSGAVEIGYSVVPEWRGQGIATECVSALVRRAFAHAGVRRVVAHTAEGNGASHAVLRRCGFACVGAGADAEYLRFEHRRHELVG
jgi:[ribosomal protein S5]-alanine N-acetyltransferase